MGIDFVTDGSKANKVNPAAMADFDLYRDQAKANAAADAAAAKAQQDAELRQATNLQQTTNPITGSREWKVVRS